jgi:hypothetical protein
MAATVKKLIEALQKFPPDMELVDRKMFAISEGGKEAYLLDLKVRLVGVGQYKEEGLVLFVAYTEDLAKIADIIKL